MVSINSIFPNERALAEFLEGQLKERGFSTHRVPIAEGRFNVVGERGHNGKPVVLYGHMDTVPVYGKWTSDPFVAREQDGKLFGLGIYDMKAGLAAMLSACDTKSDRCIRIAFGVDEENISEGAYALVREGLPEGAAAVVVPEINDSPSAQKSGKASIMLGRRGRAVFEIRVPGRSSHGAHVHDGINAISEAARLVLELERSGSALESLKHPHLPPATQFIRRISSESTSVSLPEDALLELDRHLVTPETPESALIRLREDISALYSRGIFKEIDGRCIEADIKARKTPYLAPYVTTEKDPLVKKLAEAAESELGRISYCYGASVADENVFAAQGVPVFGLGPDGGSYHAADEWVDKLSFERLVRIYSRFVASL